jgi:tetratricopeptide (TPR) repeat protein
VTPARVACAAALALLLAVGPPASSHVAAADSGASAAQDAFERANEAFAEGRYAEAADAYAAIAQRDGVSAALLFNLGNASFRAGRTGEAILAWEQARLLAPRASQIAANLRQARRAASLPAMEPDAWQRLVALLTGDGWSWLASACLTIACAAGLGGVALRGAAARPGVARAIRALLDSSLAIAAAAAATAIEARQRGVVLGREPALRVAPYASATTGRPVAAGEVVRVERGHGGFVLVRTDDGRTGWLPAEAVRRIGDLPGSQGPAGGGSLADGARDRDQISPMRPPATGAPNRDRGAPPA